MKNALLKVLLEAPLIGMTHSIICINLVTRREINRPTSLGHAIIIFLYKLYQRMRPPDNTEGKLAVPAS